MIYVKYKKLTDTATVPTRGSARAAGYDLYADTDRDVMMWPGEVVEFFTGLALEIPDGYFGAASSELRRGHRLRLQRERGHPAAE